MYQYDTLDKEFLADRAAEFREQVVRRLAGEITEDQFKPIRLMNGLYLQLDAYMLRVAIPYGSLNPTQLRVLADIGRTYDKGYGHFTTRQNLQFHWIKLADTPDILDRLAAVDMHAIQTSGNCIRNTTADPYSGATAEEVDDPRVWSEAIRQWSSLHPEFSFLPRKFKIAITGAAKDRTAAKVHDIGLMMRRSRDGALGFEVIVGGGLGRTPFVGPTIREFLPANRLVSYLEAILRVFNRHGRRDNKYKARIKILVAALGAEEFARQVEDALVDVQDAPGRLGGTAEDHSGDVFDQRAKFVPAFGQAGRGTAHLATMADAAVDHRELGYQQLIEAFQGECRALPCDEGGGERPEGDSGGHAAIDDQRKHGDQREGAQEIQQRIAEEQAAKQPQQAADDTHEGNCNGHMSRNASSPVPIC